VSDALYVVRPRADHDLDNQAFYYATEADAELGINGFERILVLYRPLTDSVEILRVIHGSRNIQALLRKEGL
jgi:plasmid stabilization system protein ParE